MRLATVFSAGVFYREPQHTIVITCPYWGCDYRFIIELGNICNDQVQDYIVASGRINHLPEFVASAQLCDVKSVEISKEYDSRSRVPRLK